MRIPTVASVMTEDVVSIRPQTPFKEIVELLTSRAVSAVPVIDDEDMPVGVVSEADLVSKEEFDGGTESVPLLAGRAARQRWHRSTGTTAAEVMSPRVFTIAATESAAAAARTLAKAGVRRLFVVDEAGRLVGVVSRRDLLKLYLRSDEQLTQEIRANVLRGGLWIEDDLVEVSVTDGVVTLAGTLPRRSDVQMATRLTQAQPGVVGVVNDLRYEFDDVTAERSGLG